MTFIFLLLTACGNAPDDTDPPPSETTSQSTEMTECMNPLPLALSDIIDRGLPPSMDLAGCVERYDQDAGYPAAVNAEEVAERCREDGFDCDAADFLTCETAVCVASVNGLQDLGVHFVARLSTRNGFVTWGVVRWSKWSETDDHESGTSWVIDGFTGELRSRDDFDAE